jgi:hypothetical protein
MGAHVIVQVECYSLPQEQVSTFFEAFSAEALEAPNYKESLQAPSFVSGIGFQISYA